MQYFWAIIKAIPAVLSKVTSDSYFSDQANWSKVYIEYKSTEGFEVI